MVSTLSDPPVSSVDGFLLHHLLFSLIASALHAR